MSRRRFNPDKWLTPNTYGANFSEPKGAGIYLLAHRKLDLKKSRVSFKILYVGMSLKLQNRLTQHEVLRELRRQFDDVVIFFRNHRGDIRALERSLIEVFNPPYNIIGRKRGL